MSANTTIHVRVGRIQWEWVEVSAVTLREGVVEASRLPGVVTVDMQTANYDGPFEVQE